MRSRLLFRIKHGSWQSYRLARKQSLSNGYLRSSEMLKVSLKNIKQELLFGDSHKFGDSILTKPVVRIESIRIILALAAANDLYILHVDCKNAFLHGKSDVELYVSQPEGFCDEEFPDKVLRLNKSLYGLKQAPRIWYLFLCGIIVGLGFVQLETDSCIYI